MLASKKRFSELEQRFNLLKEKLATTQKKLDIELEKSKIQEGYYDSLSKENSKLSNNLIKYLEVFGNESQYQVPFIMEKYEYNGIYNKTETHKTYSIPQIVIRRVEVK